MNWQSLKENIYYWDGAWRDIYIKGTTQEDWVKWVQFINSSYNLTWHNAKTDKDESQIDYELIKEFFTGKDELRSTANIFIEKIQINCHFFELNELENDIDPREFNSLEDHYKLIDYMKKLSFLLKKPVYLTPENCHDVILITVDRENVIISSDINPSEWTITTRI